MAGFGTFRKNRAFRGIAAILPAAVLAIASTVAMAAPAVPVILGPAQNAFVGTSAVAVNGTASGDAVRVRVFEGSTILADSGTSEGYWSATIGFADGTHTITAQSQDAGGAWGATTAPRTFTVDTVSPPAPTISAPADGQLIGFADITVEGTAEPLAQVRLDVDTGAPLYATAGSTGAWSITHTFTDAKHTITATAIDRAGNASLPSSPVGFTVDTSPPRAPVLDIPGDGSFTNQTVVTISGSAEPGTTVRVFEGSTIVITTPASDGTWWGSASFTPGAHTLTARAVDAAGNASAATAPITFTVDQTPPTAPVILSPSEGAFVASPLVLSGSAEPFASVDLMEGTAIDQTAVADRNGAFSFDLHLSSGGYTFTARATDRAGNTGPESAVRSFTADEGSPSIEADGANSLLIFLPTERPLLKGRAFDDVGVDHVRVDYYDPTGARTFTRTASCPECPAGTDVPWQIDFDPGLVHFSVYVYAVDRVGHESLPQQIEVLRL